MENQHNKNMPTLQDSTPAIAVSEKHKPIKAQPESLGSLAKSILAVWVAVRLDILQMSPALVPVASEEELGLVTRLMRQYGNTTPAEFGEAIRLAAIDKQRDLSSGQARFPTLYAADFEEKLQLLAMKKQREEEANAALQLPKNTGGGNEFWGTPAEALAREWPKIVNLTNNMRQINPRLRDRFWVMGSPEQKQSAFGMLRQMVDEMRAAEQLDQVQINWEALAIFQADFRAAFPKWDRLLDAGMSCPLQKKEVDELRQRVKWKIQAAHDAGSGDVPSIENFPDAQDATFCAVFDAYWKFKGEK